jgi:hypothetical protein
MEVVHPTRGLHPFVSYLSLKKSLNITSGQTCPMHVSAVILSGHHPQTSSALEEMTRRPLRLEKNQTQIPE